MSIKIQIKGMDKALAELNINRYTDKTKLALTKFGERVEHDAKQKAPVDEGRLKNAIFSEVTGRQVGGLSVKVGCSVDYAAYVEFGTRKFAAAYVSTLPSNWQQFAAQFKGPGGGTFEEFVRVITEWVERKGIVATFSVKTRKQIKNKASDARAKQAAYAIALSILKKGIKAQPYMYPAVEKNMPLLLKELGQ